MNCYYSFSVTEEKRPLEVDPDDGAEQVNDNEDCDKDDNQMTRISDDGTSCVHIRNNRPTQLIAMNTELLPANTNTTVILLLCAWCGICVYDAVCKRVLSFISKCVNSDCDLVSFSAMHAVL